MMFGRKARSQPVPVETAPTADPAATMPRGIGQTSNDQIARGEIPSASWAQSEDVVRLLRYDPNRFPGQMVLGTVGEVLIGTRPRLERAADGTTVARAEDRHLLTVAGSRAGKSVSMIVPNLLDYEGAALVTDPKAELANLTALHRAQDLGQAVFVLDPFGRASPAIRDAGLLASFNPLSMLTDPDTLVEDADLIADALVIQGGNDPHWDESAKRFLQGVILHVLTFPRYGRKRTLCTVRDLLNFGTEVDTAFIPAAVQAAQADLWSEGTPPKGIDGLLYEMRCNPLVLAHRHAEAKREEGEAAQGISDHDLTARNVVAAVAFDMAEKPDKERDSILSSVRRQTAFLDLPRMRAVLTEGTCARTIPDLSILKTAPERATIYLCLPAGYMRICSRWLRLFVDLTLKAMERSEHVERDAPVLLCLDEFPILGYMPQLEAAAGQLAGFGVRLWPIVQDLTQLKALYKDRWETFVGNAAAVQFFGNSDLTTLRYMSELVGKVAVEMKSTKRLTNTERESGGTGITRSVQNFDLLPVHEARVFYDRSDEASRQLILYQGLPPIVAGRIQYYRHPHYTAKVRESVTGPIENPYNYYMGITHIDDNVYSGNPYEEKSRYVFNSARSTKEIVVLPKIYWDYLDWLVELGASLEEMISACEEVRRDQSLSEMMAHYLYQGCQLRRDAGLPLPPWLK